MTPLFWLTLAAEKMAFGGVFRRKKTRWMLVEAASRCQFVLNSLKVTVTVLNAIVTESIMQHNHFCLVDSFDSVYSLGCCLSEFEMK